MKKLTAVLIVLCMIVSVCPAVSFAEGNALTAVQTAYFNSQDEWEQSDADEGSDNILVASSGADSWQATSSFTDTNGVVTKQSSLRGSGFHTPRNAIVEFIIPEDFNLDNTQIVTLSMTIKSVKQVSSGARLAVYANSIDKEWGEDGDKTMFGAEESDSGLDKLTCLGLASAISTGNEGNESASGETVTIATAALTEYVKQMVREGKRKITFRIAAPMGGIRIYSSNSEYAPTLKFYENVNTYSGYEVDSEGAWCWFADPRAISYKNEEGTIDVTIIGYIDVHGNIKATQVNNLTNKVDEVLIRTNLQPDDHNNPTFIVLPDERIVVFYSRHTDERCFWYRVTREKGDITTFGEEKCLVTEAKTTYPSPFILADDPEHIYLCWRGVEWHPTMAQLSLPDDDGNIKFIWGPKQVIRSKAQSSGCRPYAKYTSNGKDTIHITYTATHPDNVSPNSIYYTAIKFKDFTEGDVKVELQGVTGNTLTESLPFQVNNYETDASFVVDDRYVSKRGWVWQIALAEDGYPVIAMVRISSDKSSHDYYYVKWDGEKWFKTFITNGGGKFHPSNTERCYSGGMSIDVNNPHIIYCSKPVNGVFGNVYEIVKYTMSKDGTTILSEEQITKNSMNNNVRPWVIPDTAGKDLRVLWMHGDYYHWIVSKRYPAGYPTAIWSDSPLPKEAVNLEEYVIKEVSDTIGGAFTVTENAVNGEFTVSANILLEGDYEGNILDMGNVKLSVKNMSTLYGPDKYALRPRVVVTVGDKEYVTANVYGNSDDWQHYATGTSGDYYFTPYKGYINHTISYDGEYLTLYRDGLIDLKEKIELEGIKKVSVDNFDGYAENVYVYDRALNHDEIKELCNPSCESEKEIVKASVLSKTYRKTIIQLENMSANDVTDFRIIVVSYDNENEAIKAEGRSVSIEANGKENISFSIGGNIKAYIWDENMDSVFDELKMN